MSNHINWTQFEHIHCNNPQDAFEDLTRVYFKIVYAKDIYCHLPAKNSIHPGFECDPIQIGRELVGFQSKFTQTSPYRQFLESLDIALKHYKNKVDRIILFTNRGIDTKCDGYKKILKICKRIGAKPEFVTGTDMLDVIENDASCQNLKTVFFNDFQIEDKWFNDNASCSLELQKEKYDVNGFHLDTEETSRLMNYVFENDYHVTSNKLIDYIINEVEKHKTLKFKNTVERKYDNELYDLIAKHVCHNLTEIEFQSLGSYFKSLSNKITEDIKNTYQKLDTPSEKDNESLSSYYEYLESCDYLINSIVNTTCFGLANFSLCKSHIVEGAFGCGKTHLFKYVTHKRLLDHKRTLLLYGESFRYRDATIEEEILKCLNLSHITFDYFLSLLETKGERNCDYTYILIDAINECADFTKWRASLRKLVEKVNNCKFVKLFISLRDSYAQRCFGSDFEFLTKNRILLVHKMHGLSLYNDEIETYLNHFNISYKGISPDARETLSRPLLLNLFCKIHENCELEIIKDVDRVDILTKYVEHEEKRWSSLQPNICLLQFNKVIALIGSHVVKTHEPFMPLDELTKILSQNGVDNQNIHYMDASDIIEIQVLNDGTKIVHFFYEYFLDKACSEALIVESKEESKGNIINFIDDSLGYEKVVSGFSLILNRFKQRFNDDIDELLSKFYQKLSRDAFDHVFYEFLEFSLEEPTFPFSKLSKEYKCYIRSKQVHNLIWEKIINSQNNFKNCFILDSLLMHLSLPDRDYVWTIFINNSFDGHDENIARTLNELLVEDTQFFNDESLSLLVWVLTSSNRELRDLASKQLIRLFIKNPKIIVSILKKYITVNDPYVVSRLLASVYGSLSLLDYGSRDELKEIAKIIKDNIFYKVAYEDIQVRDYGKNIIEFIRNKGVKLSPKFNRCNPPFKSRKIPALALEDVNKYYPKDVPEQKIFYGTSSIKYSLSPELKIGDLTTPYGDFGRYVFDSKLSDFCLDKNNKEKTKIFLYAYYYIIKVLGYNNESFSSYDREHYSYRSRNTATERIGKKYEWLALFHVLARVSSIYKMKDYFEDESSSSFNGTWHPFLRDFDPTQLLDTSQRQYTSEGSTIVKEFDDFDVHDMSWVQKHKNVFDFQHQIIVNDENNKKWIAITSTILNENGKISETNVYQSRWDLIKTVCVKKDNLNKVLNSFGQSHDLDNLWNENGNYVLYAFDYSWNSSYKKYYSDNNIIDITIPHEREVKSSRRYKKNHDIQISIGNRIIYNSEVNTRFHTVTINEKVTEVYRLSHEYLWEAEYDFSKKDTIEYDVPSGYLVNLLRIKQIKSGVWADTDGNVVLRDMSLYKDSNIKGLYADYAYLKKMLPNNLSFIWLARCEVFSSSKTDSNFNDRILKTVLITFDFKSEKFDYKEISD